VLTPRFAGVAEPGSLVTSRSLEQSAARAMIVKRIHRGPAISAQIAQTQPDGEDAVTSRRMRAGNTSARSTSNVTVDTPPPRGRAREPDRAVCTPPATPVTYTPASASDAVGVTGLTYTAAAGRFPVGWTTGPSPPRMPRTTSADSPSPWDGDVAGAGERRESPCCSRMPRSALLISNGASLSSVRTAPLRASRQNAKALQSAEGRAITAKEHLRTGNTVRPVERA